MTSLSQFSRRNFLKSGGALVVAFHMHRVLHAETAEGGPTTEVDSFIAIHEDGTVTLFTSKVDVGTGLTTAFRQIAAEELGIPVECFTVVQGNTGVVPNHGGTGGSSGIPRGGADIRNAAASAHAALLERAATRLDSPVSEIEISGGIARTKTGDKSILVGQLVGGKRFDVKVNPKATLRDPSTYKVVGKPAQRPDVVTKATGRHTYVQDFKVAGMVHARIVRPSTIGSRIVTVEESSINTIPTARVVRIENFLAVVADTEWAAIRAARDLKVTWSEGVPLPVTSSFEASMTQEASTLQDQAAITRGDAPSMPAANTVTARLYWPYQSHASLGPSCAIADVRTDGATIYSATQDTYAVRGLVATLLKVPARTVQVNYLDGSGSYGTNGGPDCALDAVLISRAVSKPVRLQWTRQDEIRWDPKGPAHFIEMKAGVDANGDLLTWEGRATGPAGPQWNGSPLGLVASGIVQAAERGGGTPVTQNLDPPYAVGSIRITAKTTKNTPIRLSNLRAPGKMATVSAVEILTDEAAKVSGIDPVTYRKQRLKDPRAIAVIDRATTMLKWQPATKPVPAKDGTLTGQGFAYVHYKHSETYVAIAMEAVVNPSSGQIIVKRVACAHDCGQIINPDGLRNQVEGNIVQAISRALHEEFTADGRQITSVDWTSYPILRFREAPIVEVELIDRPGETAYGAGEAAGSPVTAALVNAVFNATGTRLDSVPFTPTRVKASLAKKA